MIHTHRSHMVATETSKQPTPVPVSFRNIPFTIVSLIMILVASTAAGVMSGPISETQTNRWGLGDESISRLRLWGLFTANYLIDKPVAIISTFVMVIVFLGWIEIRYGTMAAVATWFTGTWVATVVAAIIWWPFALLGIAQPLADVAIPEVGSSAATWTALGVVLGWPGKWSRGSLVAGLASTTFLTALLIDHRTFTSVEHLVAFAFGMLVVAPMLAGCARPVYLDPAFAARFLVGLSGVTALLTAVSVGGTGWPVMVIAGVALVILGVWPISPIPTLALLAVGGVASVLATPNPATIVVFLGAAAILVWPDIFDRDILRGAS